MPKKKYQWIAPETVTIPEELTQALATLDVPQTLAPLLYKRGIRTQADVTTFLTPDLNQLHDPFLLFDMEKAVERIQRAIIEEEAILIYGDYDADGMTSTTVLKEALELLGATVETYLPSRFTDGYGPNVRVYQEKIAAGTQLIITVDNGVSGHEALAFAKEQGVDVIVTDHHELPETLPDAYAIIHPKHPAGSYPFKELAGVGVAFKLVCALMEEVVYEALDLVAIGTVADMVSLTGENRILVAHGLQVLKQTDRLGLLALLRVSGVDPQAINGDTIGFALAPRLNALGRLSDANQAITLLSTFDDEEADQLATALDDWNTKRKALVEEVMKEATAQLKPEHQVNILVGEQWHEGILGIVAGRIMQATGKPTIVLTQIEDQKVKGSGRSVPQVDLFKLLTQWKSEYHAFGGHHSAIGMTLDAAFVPTLQAQVDRAIAELGIDLSLGIPLEIGLTLSLAEIDLSLLAAFERLAPFGMDNPLPLVEIDHVKVEQTKAIGANKDHLKCVLTQEDKTLDAIAFQMGDQLHDIQADDVAFVGKLTVNEWNNHKKVQLQVEDYMTKGIQVYDYRTKKRDVPLRPDFHYISFTTENSVFKKSLPNVTELTTAKDVAEFNASPETKAIVFVDCPTELIWLQQLYAKQSSEHYYFVFEADDDAYLDGLGTREQYARLFALIQQHAPLDVRYKLTDIAKYLKLPPKLLIFMIQVFFELKFVTIDNGVLSSVPDAAKTALSDSLTYQQRQLRMESQSFLQLTNLENLKQWFFS